MKVFLTFINMKKIILQKKRITPICMSEEDFHQLVLQSGYISEIPPPIVIPELINKNKRMIEQVVRKYDETVDNHNHVTSRSRSPLSCERIRICDK